MEQDGRLYQYDTFGWRFSKTLGAAQGGQITWFVYGPQGLLAELDANGKTTRSYGWQPGTDWDTEPLWQADHASSQNSSSRTYHYLHNDHLSTPQIASDATGRSTWQALSESFGHTLERSGNRTRMNLRFAGQYFDEEVGTHYNYYRDYQPKLGRYIESDPFGLSGGLNLFVYAEQSPLDVYDNNGLAPKYVKPDNPNKRKPPDHRIPSGERERNVGHENAEEHSRQSKKQRGSGVKGSRGARGVGGLLI